MNTMEVLEEILYPNVIAVLLAVTALVAGRRPGGRSSRVGGIILVMFVVLMVMVVLQIFNTMSNGMTMSWVPPIKYITTPLHNLFTVLYPGLCCIFVYEYSFIRGKRKWVWALLVSPAVVWAVILVLNYWKGWVFTIDENMVYHRGPLVYFTFILPLISVLVGFIITRTGSPGNKNFIRFPIWTFALPAVGGVAVQAVVEGVNTIHLGLAIGLCGACISIQKERLYLDTLTGLYNRSYLFYIFSRIEKNKKATPVGAIMIDINDFKYINDEFGHQEGDNALAETAAILKKSLVKGGTAIRFAGDEFIIFMRQQDVKSALSETLERIKFNTDVFNNSGTNMYKLHFAVGSSVMKEDEEPDDLLARIDKEMYLHKAHTKAKSGIVRRRA